MPLECQSDLSKNRFDSIALGSDCNSGFGSNFALISSISLLFSEIENGLISVLHVATTSIDS